jgi:deoxyribose-phosphate aldolase
MTTIPTSAGQLARHIDHTLLKPEATRAQVDKLCDECREHAFAAACVNPYWVTHVAERLAGSTTDVAAVVGFPLGATTTAQKAFEAQAAVQAGAREIDMVVNLGALLDEERDAVIDDIRAVVEAARAQRADAVVKVILETRALTDAQIELGCLSCVEAGADYVKTSTGFHPAGGATVEHVRLMARCAAPLKVKAAGGIRDLATTLAMLEAGADRLGMSAGVSVVQDMGRTR